jgi:hypothetical protein
MRCGCWALGWLTLLAPALARPAPAELRKPITTDPLLVDALDVTGTTRTSAGTIRSLLPRDPPARFSSEELVEFERRLNNLAVFDAVRLERAQRRLTLRVREKWTLIPTLDFATGSTFADTYLALGATEYNFMGTAAELGVLGSWDQRRPNGAVWWSEHDYKARDGAVSALAHYTSASFRFATGEAWIRDQAGAVLAFKLPYSYGSPLRYQAAFLGFHERVVDPEAAFAPPPGNTLGVTLTLAWDRYTFRDLTPSGYVFTLEGSAAAFVPQAKARHRLLTSLLAALAPTDTTVLAGRFSGEAVSSGNPNHSLLLGSFNAVRGLDDAFHRNQAQLVSNVELRQAVRIAERWALQGALFADAAVFRPFDARGRVRTHDVALAAGAGVRVIPTLLAGLVIRLDGSLLVEPEERWFWQLAFGQFF